MALYIAEGNNQGHPVIMLVFAPSKEAMRKSGYNMRLKWVKYDEAKYKVLKSEALNKLSYTYQHPEDGLREGTVK